MRNIYITFFLFTAVLVATPLVAVAQTSELQTTQIDEEEQAALKQVAVQLEEIEQEVNRLTLLVTKIALEKQAVDLQRQLAVLLSSEESVAVAPVAMQEPPAPKAVSSTEPPSLPQADSASQNNIFAKVDIQKDEEEKETRFAAALGPLGNLGKPELAALVILALLAMFVLARRLRDRKKSSLPQAPQPFKPESSLRPERSSQTSQPSSQSEPTLLQEGRQELSEKVAWK